jgi:predicted DCC family thiol-disulfide oxidoreductase YuxK
MPDAIVLYDDDCGFCRWCLAKLLAWDRRRTLRPIPLQDPEAGKLLAGMPEAERMASWHLVADGEVRSGGAALAPLLRRLPGGDPLAALAERLPRAVAGGYRFVANHRTAFGRFVTSGSRRRADRRIASRKSA